MEQIAAGANGFKQFSESTDEVCDVHSVLEPEAFRTVSRSTSLSGGLLIDASSTPVQYERTPRHVARGGIDHYQIAMYLDGEAEFAAGRRSAHLRAGDICLIDMAQANVTRMKAGTSGVARVLTLVVPRAQLAPLLATPDSLSASVIAADTPSGRHIGADWVLKDPEGNQIMSGSSAESIRRQPAGNWLYAIDHAAGASLPAM